jgi:hypothetical protein
MGVRIQDTAVSYEQQERTTRVRVAGVLGGCAALAAVAMSFLPWLEVSIHGSFGNSRVQSIDGKDLTGVTGFGDGIATALAATAVIVSALFLVWSPSVKRLAGGLFLAAGLLIGLIGAYDILNDRDYEGSSFPPFTVDFSPTVWIYLLTTAGVVIGICGLYLIGPARRGQNDGLLEEATMTERAEGWA